MSEITTIVVEAASPPVIIRDIEVLTEQSDSDIVLLNNTTESDNEIVSAQKDPEEAAEDNKSYYATSPASSSLSNSEETSSPPLSPQHCHTTSSHPSDDKYTANDLPNTSETVAPDSPSSNRERDLNENGGLSSPSINEDISSSNNDVDDDSGLKEERLIEDSIIHQDTPSKPILHSPSKQPRSSLNASLSSPLPTPTQSPSKFPIRRGYIVTSTIDSPESTSPKMLSQQPQQLDIDFMTTPLPSPQLQVQVQPLAQSSSIEEITTPSSHTKQAPSDEHVDAMMVAVRTVLSSPKSTPLMSPTPPLPMQVHSLAQTQALSSKNEKVTPISSPRYQTTSRSPPATATSPSAYPPLPDVPEIFQSLSPLHQSSTVNNRLFPASSSSSSPSTNQSPPISNYASQLESSLVPVPVPVPAPTAPSPIPISIPGQGKNPTKKKNRDKKLKRLAELARLDSCIDVENREPSSNGNSNGNGGSKINQDRNQIINNSSNSNSNSNSNSSNDNSNSCRASPDSDQLRQQLAQILRLDDKHRLPTEVWRNCSPSPPPFNSSVECIPGKSNSNNYSRSNSNDDDSTQPSPEYGTIPNNFGSGNTSLNGFINTLTDFAKPLTIKLKLSDLKKLTGSPAHDHSSDNSNANNEDDKGEIEIDMDGIERLASLLRRAETSRKIQRTIDDTNSINSLGGSIMSGRSIDSDDEELWGNSSMDSSSPTDSNLNSKSKKAGAKSRIRSDSMDNVYDGDADRDRDSQSPSEFSRQSATSPSEVGSATSTSTSAGMSVSKKEAAKELLAFLINGGPMPRSSLEVTLNASSASLSPPPSSSPPPIQVKVSPVASSPSPSPSPSPVPTKILVRPTAVVPSPPLAIKPVVQQKQKDGAAVLAEEKEEVFESKKSKKQKKKRNSITIANSKLAPTTIPEEVEIDEVDDNDKFFGDEKKNDDATPAPAPAPVQPVPIAAVKTPSTSLLKSHRLHSPNATTPTSKNEGSAAKKAIFDHTPPQVTVVHTHSPSISISKSKSKAKLGGGKSMATFNSFNAFSDDDVDDEIDNEIGEEEKVATPVKATPITSPTNKKKNAKNQNNNATTSSSNNRHLKTKSIISSPFTSKISLYSALAVVLFAICIGLSFTPFYKSPSSSTSSHYKTSSKDSIIPSSFFSSSPSLPSNHPIQITLTYPQPASVLTTKSSSSPVRWSMSSNQNHLTSNAHMQLNIYLDGVLVSVQNANLPEDVNGRYVEGLWDGIGDLYMSRGAHNFTIVCDVFGSGDGGDGDSDGDVRGIGTSVFLYMPSKEMEKMETERKKNAGVLPVDYDNLSIQITSPVVAQVINFPASLSLKFTANGFDINANKDEIEVITVIDESDTSFTLTDYINTLDGISTGVHSVKVIVKKRDDGAILAEDFVEFKIVDEADSFDGKVGRKQNDDSESEDRLRSKMERFLGAKREEELMGRMKKFVEEQAVLKEENERSQKEERRERMVDGVEVRSAQTKELIRLVDSEATPKGLKAEIMKELDRRVADEGGWPVGDARG